MKFPEVRLASYVATVFIMLLAVDGSSARAATSSAPQSTTTAAKGWGGLGAFFSKGKPTSHQPAEPAPIVMRTWKFPHPSADGSDTEKTEVMYGVSKMGSGGRYKYDRTCHKDQFRFLLVDHAKFGKRPAPTRAYTIFALPFFHDITRICPRIFGTETQVSQPRVITEYRNLTAAWQPPKGHEEDANQPVGWAYVKKSWITMSPRGVWITFTWTPTKGNYQVTEADRALCVFMLQRVHADFEIGGCDGFPAIMEVRDWKLDMKYKIDTAPIIKSSDPTMSVEHINVNADRKELPAGIEPREPRNSPPNTNLKNIQNGLERLLRRPESDEQVAPRLSGRNHPR